MPAEMPPAQASRLLADHAEYGRWELARSARYWGGAKRVWLRRKTLTVEPTYWL
jgi:hypothetical protein